MRRHRWEKIMPHRAIQFCRGCMATREVLAIVGIRYPRELRTHVRGDGVRFTGFTPECTKEFFVDGAMRVINIASGVRKSMGKARLLEMMVEEGPWYQVYRTTDQVIQLSASPNGRRDTNAASEAARSSVGTEDYEEMNGWVNCEGDEGRHRRVE